MKAIFTLLLFNLTVLAQVDQVIGDYTLVLKCEDTNLLEYQLTLNQDGTFSFHYHSYIKRGIPPEKNYYGKGSWSIANNVISFFSNTQKDLDEKHTMDFTNTKARFIIKSARDTSDKVVKTSLQFLASDIPWMGRVKLYKN
jgi:NlpE N-terminal domain